jgi:uncharacterized protein (UPF0297 family)
LSPGANKTLSYFRTSPLYLYPHINHATMPPVRTLNTDTISYSNTPQRHQTLPPAATAAAREALQSFYCELCSKGYSRMNDYEAHLSSYDHSHKQRLKDMKAMVRDPNAVARARKAEAKADGIVSIKIGQADAQSGGASSGGGGGGGFKKGGFKKSGFKSAFAPVDAPAPPRGPDAAAAPARQPEGAEKALAGGGARSELVESDTDDEDYKHYDPRYPTD